MAFHLTKLTILTSLVQGDILKVNDKLVRQRIYDRARELISTRGLKGWNMDQLASSAGLTKPTLYKIISSKEELIESVIIDHIRSMQMRILEITEQEEDYVRALERMLLEYPSFFQSGHVDYMTEVLMEYPAIEKKVLKHRDNITELLIRFIDFGLSTGQVRENIEPATFFNLLRAIVHFNVTLGLQGEERADQIRSMFDLVMNGVRAT